MEQYNDEIQLKAILIKLSEYKAYLLKKKFAILLVSSLCFILGILFAILSDVKYNAELTWDVGTGVFGNILQTVSEIELSF